jgi:hypothetical protein
LQRAQHARLPARAEQDKLLCALAELQILQFHWKEALATLSSVDDEAACRGIAKSPSQSNVHDTLVVLKLLSRLAMV